MVVYIIDLQLLEHHTDHELSVLQGDKWNKTCVIGVTSLKAAEQHVDLLMAFCPF